MLFIAWKPLLSIHFHCMEESSSDILINIAFCVESSGFGMTWGWVNDDSVLFFGWIVLLSLFFFYLLCLLMRCKANVYLHPEVITPNTCSAIKEKSQDETCCIFSSTAVDRREPGEKWKYLLSFSAFVQMVFLSHSSESLLSKQVGKYHTKIQAYAGEDCWALLFQTGRKRHWRSNNLRRLWILYICFYKKQQQTNKTWKVQKDNHDAVYRF